MEITQENLLCTFHVKFQMTLCLSNALPKGQLFTTLQGWRVLTMIMDFYWIFMIKEKQGNFNFPEQDDYRMTDRTYHEIAAPTIGW